MPGRRPLDADEPLLLDENERSPRHDSAPQPPEALRRGEEGRAREDRALQKGDLDADPLKQFRTWFDEAKRSNLIAPDAAALATADSGAKPSVRMVLIKEIGLQGIAFYTNYQSRKAGELDANPQAAIAVYWDALDRQVRIEGLVERASRETSRRYFASRPYLSQLGAWASPQSQPIEGRGVLDERIRELKQVYPEGQVPLPPYWGGYILIPDAFEYWQSRPNRLHDRFRYEREGDRWRLTRLAP